MGIETWNGSLMQIIRGKRGNNQQKIWNVQRGILRRHKLKKGTSFNGRIMWLLYCWWSRVVRCYIKQYRLRNEQILKIIFSNTSKYSVERRDCQQTRQGKLTITDYYTNPCSKNQNKQQNKICFPTLLLTYQMMGRILRLHWKAVETKLSVRKQVQIHKSTTGYWASDHVNPKRTKLHFCRNLVIGTVTN